MWKWIAGIAATVVGGLLLQISTNFLHLDGHDGGGSSSASSASSSSGGGDPPPSLKPVVMGPLEIGTNRQGDDFDAFGQPAANAQLCAEACRTDASCEAMTYVKSGSRCWLKSGVPAASADADMISAVKKKP